VFAAHAVLTLESHRGMMYYPASARGLKPVSRLINRRYKIALHAHVYAVSPTKNQASRIYQGRVSRGELHKRYKVDRLKR